MINPLNKVPFNTNRCFVMATSQSGCEVYMPVNNSSDRAMKTKRDELQSYMDSQKQPPLRLA